MSTEDSYGTLGSEIQSAKEYLSLKSSEDKEKFSYDFSVDPQADTHIPVPGALIKSFVENTFLNNLSQHSEGGKIDISIHRTTLGILIMITDNALLRYQEYNRGRIIGNRLELLDQDILEFNKEHECSINYQLLDLAYSEPGQTGSRVLITIVI